MTLDAYQRVSKARPGDEMCQSAVETVDPADTFEAHLPRSDAGKPYKQQLIDKYSGAEELGRQLS
jgi:hypothetical protein